MDNLLIGQAATLSPRHENDILIEQLFFPSEDLKIGQIAILYFPRVKLRIKYLFCYSHAGTSMHFWYNLTISFAIFTLPFTAFGRSKGARVPES